jgi:hypothetical protein
MAPWMSGGERPKLDFGGTGVGGWGVKPNQVADA